MRKFVLLSIGLVILAAAVIGGVAGRFLSQHIYGEERWLAWKQERISKGDRYEWNELVPPDIPDAENFAKAPLVSGAILKKEWMNPRFKLLELPKAGTAWGNWREGTRVDLQTIQAAYGTSDLLQALAPYEPALRELEEASLRPRSKIPVDYSECDLPALLGFRSATRMLGVRALAQLSNGNSRAALADVSTCLRVSDHLRAEPCLLASFLRQAVLGTALQVIWEGLMDHRWNELQLEFLQRELLHVDLLASARLGWEGERLMCISLFARKAEGLPTPRGFQVPKQPDPPLHFNALTRGWWYRNMLEMDRFYVSTCLEVIDPKAHRVYPEKYVSPSQWYEQRKYRKDLLMALIAIPPINGQQERQAQLQSYLDQAAIVCALERYRLVKTEYPKELQQLSPAFLQTVPRDITTGNPLHYAREGDGFRLYSCGWDQQDDRGTLSWKLEEGKRVLNIGKGDWPWVTLKP
jgi:hypothetical protein